MLARSSRRTVGIAQSHRHLWLIRAMSTYHPETITLGLRGAALLNNPTFNKGSAFTHKEKSEFGIRGRLPYAVDTLDEQVARAYQQYSSRETDILKNSFLQSLKSQNQTLFYALLSRNLKEMFPIIYTPTEAEAIANYSHLFRRSEGLYLTPAEEGSMEEDFLEACEGRELELIVVSDAEAILGIGDQGSGGMGISSAKAVIYTLAAGVDPSKALAVSLDVGTNNQELLDDDLYLGVRERRLRGEEYDAFVDHFVSLVKKHQPKCLLHFEDFGVTNAQRLLARYREQLAVFNDDIQGTGAVTLAALQAAIKINKSALKDQRIVIFGAGSAGLGIARQLRDAIRLSSSDISDDQASQNIYLVDKDGLIRRSLGKKIRDEIESAFIKVDKGWNDGDGGADLAEVVKNVKPTILIGTSTQPGAFTEEIIREMAKHVDRPIILPLSNPTKLHEVQWTNGKALIATGSPFPPVEIPNSNKKYNVAECNNALIYPGLGLGAILADAKQMTDQMIIAGARRLAELSPASDDPDQALLPDFEDALEVNFEVAVAVAQQAVKDGVARAEVPKQEDELRNWAKAKRWEPVYAEYKYDPAGRT